LRTFYRSKQLDSRSIETLIDTKARRTVYNLDEKQVRNRKEVVQAWNKPEAGWGKLNIDVGF
jgi:hypothetical protein